MSTAMDMFLCSSDSLPFPDILDIDIKSEIETLGGGDSDFSCYNLNSHEPLLFEDVEDLKWFNGGSTQSILDFSNDDTMVNPNAVMPVMSLPSNVLRSPSPAIAQSQSHLAFSPSALKVATLKADAASVKKNLSKLDETDVVRERSIAFSSIKPITKITPILAKSNLRPLNARTSTAHSLPTILLRNKQITAPVMTQVANITTIRTIPTTTISQTITRKSVPITKAVDNEDERTYPKPGYSYSCLIAMALKNSKTGSLPVSEIYGFMCKHFPYFKTAPNGWKNSVRHNLSLNKCFEKIEKHALNGSQRKGCLWAMNPAKILKMDEEVQKWSRKDPNAIRKAMSNPENLDALERGELKFSCSYSENENFGDPCGSADSGEGSEDSDEESQENIETEVAEIDVDEEQLHYIQVSDEDSEEYEEVTEYQSGDDGIEEDKKLLEVEMALAQEELLKYEKPISEKRKRTYYMEC